MLARIAQIDIRRDVCARIEIAKQVKTLCLFIYMKQNACNQDPVFYLQPKKIIRYNELQKRLRNRHYTCDVNITKSLSKGYARPYTTW